MAAYDIRQRAESLMLQADDEWRFWVEELGLGQIATSPVCDEQIVAIDIRGADGASAGSRLLAIQYLSDGSLVLKWNGGLLEASGDLTANAWIELPQLRSPVLVRAEANARFFRVVE